MKQMVQPVFPSQRIHWMQISYLHYHMDLLDIRTPLRIRQNALGTGILPTFTIKINHSCIGISTHIYDINL